MPALARISVAQAVMSSPLKRMRPPVTSYSGDAEQRGGEGGLAGPVGPHEGVHLAGRDREVDPAQDLGAASGGAGAEALDLEEGRRTCAPVY